MSCPFSKGSIRPDLPPAPPRIAKLEVDARGWPIPWFVSVRDPEPNFISLDPRQYGIALRSRICWICGDLLGRYFTFVVGPMGALNRITSEPPSHRECADYAVRSCPWLIHPNMKRRGDESNQPAHLVGYNPGVNVTWTTQQLSTFWAQGHRYIRLHTPTEVMFWKEGRPATRLECIEAAQHGFKNVEALSRSPEESDENNRRMEALRLLFPTS